MFLDHTQRRNTVGRTHLDELITRPEEFYRLWCVVVCDLETSKIGAPYIYDISSLRVNDLTLILLTWRKWWAPNNASKQEMGFNSAFKGLMQLTKLLTNNHVRGGIRMSDPNMARNVVTAWQPGVPATNLWHNYYTINSDARSIYSSEGRNGEISNRKTTVESVSGIKSTYSLKQTATVLKINM